MNQNSLRSNLYNFLGAVLLSYSNKEEAISIIIEELTKIISKEGDAKIFENNTVKPLLKAASFVISQRHDKLLEDSKETFGDNIPEFIMQSLNDDKELVNQLQEYIKKLGE
jgi:Asp-tRNA(Asn)/Glu-tRNA(Gln) amidotransferase C subunit